ncbi:MAG TPA: crotonase/enoyl-CoA hydratase family protein [Polyangiales bacterium]|nr:crotonase/enoyl-CoA hydratase family protein [Polyangiales bacterium]
MTVSYEFDAAVATIRMDDGKANVMTEGLLDGLARAFDRAEADRAVVVLTGRGRVFSAGYDLATFQRPPSEIKRVLRHGGEVVHRILSFPFPVIAACNGHAIAQGAFTLIAADVRIGVSGDFKIGLNEVAIGLTIPHYGVELARARLTVPGFQHAACTGTLYAPDEALRMGFFDRVVHPSQLMAASYEHAKALAKLDMAAHAGTKARVRAPALAAMRAGIDTELS